ncbi:MAG TPA: ELWxxDGT repeat protein [Thermoanaerobaculia bacterium]
MPRLHAARRSSSTAILCAVLILAALSPLAAAPRLVKDLDTVPARSQGFVDDPGVAAGGVLYFTASDPAHGIELWRSDGTAAGTYRLTDVCAGPCDGHPLSLAAAGGRVFFTADDGFSGRELWVSDGTPGSERRLLDLCPGPCNSVLGSLTGAGGRLFFTRQTTAGLELWKSDGTPGGTVRLATLCTGQDPVCTTRLELPDETFGDRVLVRVFDNQTLTGWVSDGTAAGTMPLATLLGPGVPPAIGLPEPPEPGDTFLYLFTTDGLWRTDLTPAGTSRIATYAELDPAAPAGIVAIARTAVSAGALYILYVNGDMVRSDGTPAGTGIVSHLDPRLEVDDLVPLRGGVLAKTSSPALVSGLLWIGPTPGPPVSLTDLGTGSSIPALAPLADRVVFLVDLVDRPGLPDTREVWITDGTHAGTRRLRGAPFLLGPPSLVATDRLAFFLPASSASDFGRQLWATDGTWFGTRLVHDFATGPGAGGPLAQAAIGGELVFSARTSETTAPLFASDGTARGTRSISLQASWGDGFTRVGNDLFFASRPPVPNLPITQRPSPLWRTDGTALGTRLISPAIVGFGNPAALGDRLLFSAAREVSPFNGADVELFASDGTRRGTGLVKNIDPYDTDTFHNHICVGESSNPAPGVVIRGQLVFAAGDSDHGRELWATDGTPRATRLLADIDPLHAGEPPPGACSDGDTRTDFGLSSDPAGFVRYRRGALFTADDGSTGRELWLTDGTTAGTRRVVDLRPGPQGSSPHDLVAFGSDVYFVASADGEGEALWKSDGTAAGTVEVSDLRPAGSTTPSWAGELTVSGGRFFFAVYNETTGAELWTSAGDAASTRLVADLRPGPGSSSPQQLADVGGRLVFAADDGTTGVEPWVSDGTAAGTRRLGDIHPGRDASSPGPFTLVGGNLLFGADDGVHGRELWAIPLADLAP